MLVPDWREVLKISIVAIQKIGSNTVFYEETTFI